MVPSNFSFLSFRVIFHWTMAMAERVMFQMCFFPVLHAPNMNQLPNRMYQEIPFRIIWSWLRIWKSHHDSRLFWEKKKVSSTTPTILQLKNHPRNSANHQGEFQNFAFYFIEISVITVLGQLFQPPLQFAHEKSSFAEMWESKSWGFFRKPPWLEIRDRPRTGWRSNLAITI